MSATIGDKQAPKASLSPAAISAAQLAANASTLGSLRLAIMRSVLAMVLPARHARYSRRCSPAPAPAAVAAVPRNPSQRVCGGVLQPESSQPQLVPLPCKHGHGA